MVKCSANTGKILVYNTTKIYLSKTKDFYFVWHEPPGKHQCKQKISLFQWVCYQSFSSFSVSSSLDKIILTLSIRLNRLWWHWNVKQDVQELTVWFHSPHFFDCQVLLLPLFKKVFTDGSPPNCSSFKGLWV